LDGEKYILDQDFFDSLPEKYENNINQKKTNRFMISDRLLTDKEFIILGKERKEIIEKKNL
jgi:hypothetical protein